MNICEAKKTSTHSNVRGIPILSRDETARVRLEYIAWHALGVAHAWPVGTHSSWLTVPALKIILWEVCWEYLLFYRALNRENLMEEIWINVPKFISPYLTYFVSFVKKYTNKLNAPLDVLCYVITRMTLIISRTSLITFPFRSIKILTDIEVDLKWTSSF